MNEIIGAGIVVVGWLVAHYLTLRAQRIGFRNQLLERARMEIARSIHAYEKWLALFLRLCFAIEREVSEEIAGEKPSWIRSQDDVRALADDLPRVYGVEPEPAGIRHSVSRNPRHPRRIVSAQHDDSRKSQHATGIHRSDAAAACFSEERRKSPNGQSSMSAFAAEQASLLRQLRVQPSQMRLTYWCQL